MEAAIFDLDDTLLDSSSIRALRDSASWDEVRSAIPDIGLFDGVSEMLHQLKQWGLKIAIVTSSPRWYAEAIITNLSLPIDVIVAAGDYTWGKPSPKPIEKAMAELKLSKLDKIISIGDRCVDIASSHEAHIQAIGATWGCVNMRDLHLSWPEFIASEPRDVISIVNALRSPDLPKTQQTIKHGWISNLNSEYVWKTNPAGDRREHLSGVYDYIHARYRYKGFWSLSRSNAMIKSLKSKASNQRFFKVKAAKQFAMELGWLIPKSAYVTYVLPSAKKGEIGYDDRFELIAQFLSQKQIRSVFPVNIKQTTPPAHEDMPDSELRDPEYIRNNLEWASQLPPDCSELYIVDDVLTKGGHLRAYADFIKSAYPDLSIKCVAWALHTSAAWHAV